MIIYERFHNGGPYHVETNPLTFFAMLYDRDLLHESVIVFLLLTWSR